MRVRVLLAALLLGVSFCFVPALGYGEVKKWVAQINMDVDLLQIRISYMMSYPNSFLYVDLAYDPTGLHGRIAGLPESVDTKGKISVVVGDNRGIFSDKSRKALLDSFKRELEIIYSYIQLVATDMDADIVAKFYSGKEIPLGYFYQGEYYLWKK